MGYVHTWISGWLSHVSPGPDSDLSAIGFQCIGIVEAGLHAAMLSAALPSTTIKGVQSSIGNAVCTHNAWASKSGDGLCASNLYIRAPQPLVLCAHGVKHMSSTANCIAERDCRSARCHSTLVHKNFWTGVGTSWKASSTDNRRQRQCCQHT